MHILMKKIFFKVDMHADKSVFSVIDFGPRNSTYDCKWYLLTSACFSCKIQRDIAKALT